MANLRDKLGWILLAGGLLTAGVGVKTISQGQSYRSAPIIQLSEVTDQMVELEKEIKHKTSEELFSTSNYGSLATEIVSKMYIFKNLEQQRDSLEILPEVIENRRKMTNYGLAGFVIGLTGAGMSILGINKVFLPKRKRMDD